MSFQIGPAARPSGTLSLSGPFKLHFPVIVSKMYHNDFLILLNTQIVPCQLLATFWLLLSLPHPAGLVGNISRKAQCAMASLECAGLFSSIESKRIQIDALVQITLTRFVNIACPCLAIIHGPLHEFTDCDL